MNVRFVVASILLFSVMAGTAVFAQTSHFTEREVTFENDSVVLSGTLILPNVQTPSPAIVFLHGSGPHARAGFRPYAEEFAKLGIASLIFDKRGSGKSGSSWMTASLEDLASDALSAVEFLKKIDDIDKKRIGFWGVSQAGWVAPLAASRSKDIAFMILVSGGGASPIESELFSYRQGFVRDSFSEDEIAQATTALDAYFDYLSTGKGRVQVVGHLDSFKTVKLERLGEQLNRILPSEKGRHHWSWVATYDPTIDIEKVTCPMLLMFGAKDSNQPTELACKQWRKSLDVAGNERASIVVFPNAGHGIRLRDGHTGHGRAPFADGYHELQIGWLWKNVINVETK